MNEFIIYEDMMSDVFDEDFSNEIVTEAYQQRTPQNGEIWIYEFNNYNGKSGRAGKKERRVLILPDERFKQKVVMIGSYADLSDDESTNPSLKGNGPLNYKIPDPASKGFTKKVFAACNTLRKLSEGVPYRPTNYVLPKEDIDAITKLIDKFEKMRYTNPWLAMSWFNYICLEGEPTNDKPLKSFYDVKNTENANCVDLSYFIYTICKNHHIQSRIVKITASENENHSEGHLCTIFGNNRKYVFRYITPYGKSHIGECIKCETSSFDKAAQSESDYMNGLFSNHPKLQNKKFTTGFYILSRSDIAIWNQYVINKKTQRELMKIIEQNAKSEKILLQNIN